MAETLAEQPSGCRPLGYSEIFYHLFVEQFSASQYMHIIVVESSEKLSSEDVRKAFLMLVKKQEVLQMKITAEGAGQDISYSYTPCENVDKFEMLITAISTVDDWVHLVNQENYSTLDLKNGPLFKVVMATVEQKSDADENHLGHSCVLILKAHHAIIDAKSAFDVLYYQFMPILSAIVNKGDAEKSTSFVPLCKPCDRIYTEDKGKSDDLPWYMTLGIKLLRVKNRIFGFPPELFLRYPEDPDTVNMPEEEWKKIPMCSIKRFSKELTASILRNAKGHGLSVHSVLVMACATALSALCEEIGIQLPNKLSIMWPVDIRKFLDFKTPQPLGVFVGNGTSSVPKKHNYTDEEFWKTCKKVHDGIKVEGSEENFVRFLGFGKYMAEEAKKMNLQELLSGFGFMSQSVISNNGNCDVGPAPDMTSGNVQLKMTEQYFSITGNGRLDSRGFLFFHTVSTFQGQIMWNANYNTRNISQKFTKNFLQKIEETCQKYCE